MREYTYRTIYPEEAARAAEIEQICFPPNEACAWDKMIERVRTAPELFLVTVDDESGEIVACLNGLATDENTFRDEFFTNAGLFRQDGKNIMLLGLGVLPEYRHQGIARELMRRYAEMQMENERECLILTCLPDKVAMYEKMGFEDGGISTSSWGGEEWHEMRMRLHRLMDSQHTLMPLLGAAYVPGHCLETALAIADEKEREIALGEYYYFSGHPEEAASHTEPFLAEQSLGLRLSACFVYGYANLAMNRIPNSRYALDQINKVISEMGENSSSQERTMTLFISRSAATLLHLPLEDGKECGQDESVSLNLLSPGLRLFACYVRAHQAYLKQDYSRSIGIIDTAIELTPEVCPISMIYLHLAATMDYMSLKQPEQAKEHLLKAWELAKPDDLLEPFGEHHGLLGGSLEAVIKKDWPEDFRRMIEITYGFSAGWRKIHNPDTGDEVADNLTTTEFAIAMLASRNWTNQEIAAHMGLSANTVKWNISVILNKLGLARRSDLKKRMLR